MIALLLAVPAVSFAGSATSRWDMTIGGAVKFDTGYIDQNANSGYTSSRRQNSSTDYQVGNYFMNTTETALNFFIKGPDTLGAKTSAFIQGDFLGGWAKNGTNGQFTGMIMKAQMDWANTTIEFGTFPTVAGMYPTFGGMALMYGAVNQHGKGFPNTPQIVWTQRLGKALSFKIGAIDLSGPPGWQFSNSSNNSNFSREGFPGLEANFAWTSDACGKIGPFQLGAKTTFTGGREHKLNVNGAGGQADSWYWDIAAIIPIIPEKNGNKGGSLLFDAIYFTSQNASPVVAPAPAHSSSMGDVIFPPNLNPALPGFNAFQSTTNGLWQGSYQRNHDWTAPIVDGWEGHATYWFTSSVFTNVFYGYTRAHMSQALMNGAGAFGVQNNQTWIVNLMWDASPALRLGVEWDNMNTRYASTFGADSKKGTMNAYRIGAIYYF
jgi:hypothetical protein